MKNPKAALIAALIFLSACSTTREVTEINTERYPSPDNPTEIAARIPDYQQQLMTVKGKGRALVSEEGQSDRFTLEFEANKELSLITVKNRIGIVGGEFLVDADSILIYNKIDKIAQKVSVFDGRMTSLNELASVNVINLLNYTVSEGEIESVLENKDHYFLQLFDDTEIRVSKKSGLIESVQKPLNDGAPYSRIDYEGYGEIEGFTLPRKISIFSRDGSSRVAFLIRSLELNPDHVNLELKIPESVRIERL
jgi:hypothetical protein